MKMSKFFFYLIIQSTTVYAEDGVSPYMSEELTEISSHSNMVEERQRQLQSNFFCLNLGLALQECSLVLETVLEFVNEQNVILNVMALKELCDEKLSFSLSELNPVKIDFDNSNGQRQLKALFEEKIYDYTGIDVKTCTIQLFIPFLLWKSSQKSSK